MSLKDQFREFLSYYCGKGMIVILIVVVLLLLVVLSVNTTLGIYAV
jgi:competence protein ComGC